MPYTNFRDEASKGALICNSKHYVIDIRIENLNTYFQYKPSYHDPSKREIEYEMLRNFYAVTCIWNFNIPVAYICLVSSRIESVHHEHLTENILMVLISIPVLMGI